MKLNMSLFQTTVLTVGVPRELDVKSVCAEIYHVIPDGYPMPRLKDGISVSAGALGEHLENTKISDKKMADFFRAVLAHQPQPDEFMFVTE